MGNVSQFCTDWDSAPINNELLQMFEEAQNTTLQDQNYSSLLTKNRDKLSQLIKKRNKTQEMIGDVMVKVVPYSKNPSYIMEEAIQREIKLVLRADFANQSQKTELIQGSSKLYNLSYKGCIVYSNSYYNGEIMNEEPHGTGTLYTREIDQHQITGNWVHGELRKGKICLIRKDQHGRKTQQLILELQLIRGQKQAVVRVQDRLVYRGSVNLKNATSYAEILTGEGVVKFSNGDQYHGRLVKGVYETEFGKTATFIYGSGECLSFKGSYRGGLREDIGVYELDMEGARLSLHMTFINGVPCERALARLEDGSSYSINLQNQSLLVQSRIQL